MRSPAVLAAVLAAALAIAPSAGAQGRPTVDDLVGLKRPGSPAISPDGRWVAYSVREASWTDNEYVSQIWLVGAAGGAPRQLTQAKKSSDSPAWSPDGRQLAFVSARSGKRQVYLLDLSGGEAVAITSGDEGILDYAWSPDGRAIAYTAVDPRTAEAKAREEREGSIEYHGEERQFSHLHLLDLPSRTARRLTEGAFAVGRFSWSPDGRSIAFDHRPDRDLANDFDADISVVSVGDRTVRPLVVRPAFDATPVWSPDGTRIAFTSSMDAKEPYYYTTSRLAVIDAAGGPVQQVRTTVDESPILVGWGPAGIYFWTFERTWAYLYSADPGSGATRRYAPADEWVGTSFSLTKDFGTAAFIAADRARFTEVFVAELSTMTGRRLTEFGAQVAGWPVSSREVVTWKSQDGTPIEGVLHKPPDFAPHRRYPLLVIVHGGPATASRPIPYAPTSPTYPIDVWLARGTVILEPNYRGSSGYGERFRMLNIRNLGVGDAWDVLSGIDALVAQGIADPDRVGLMGWSQGGYISAFLTLHDGARFKAVSVGAGISDWATYYVNTDIHPFTRRYLKATPWDDPAIYAKTSPVSYAKGARAPTLIQHGGSDPRVPVPNAYELYQAIRDQGVPSRLAVFRGMGHSFTTPKANRAAMEQNLEWFGRYIWGESPPVR